MRAPANRTAGLPATVTVPIRCAPEPGNTGQTGANLLFKATKDRYIQVNRVNDEGISL
jgi:hypothetical protein